MAETCVLCYSSWQTRSSCWYLFLTQGWGDTQFFAHLEMNYSLDIRFQYLYSKKCSQITGSLRKIEKNLLRCSLVNITCMQHISKFGEYMQPFSQIFFYVIIWLYVFYTLFKMDMPASLSHGKSTLQWNSCWAALVYWWELSADSRALTGYLPQQVNWEGN